MAESTSALEPDQSADRLTAAFLLGKQRLVVLTGAGISVGSGIPTYRDENGIWLRSEPIQHLDFVSRETVRQRYWLRSYVGWPHVDRATPSVAHRALQKLEALGTVSLTVTQNVDRLHQKAGSQRVIDLHGRLDEVICLDCSALCSRQQVQAELDYLGELLHEPHELAPDGDADIEEVHARRVIPPVCKHCGGILKPNVVFFGDNVDKAIVADIYQAIDEADGLLIVGSSLKVFSGYRFCRYANTKGLPIASINPGVTRADELINVTIRADADAALSRVTTLR